MSSYKDLQTKIFERDNYTCRYCGKSSREYRALVMTHIRTASMCGDDRESNLITLCRHCYNHISNNEITVRIYTENLAKVRADWKKAKALSFDESSVNCPMCGQKLPEDKIESMRTDFDERKAKNLKELEDRGNALSNDGIMTALKMLT